MNTCEKIQEFFVDALYNELGAEDRKTLEQHLKDCSTCAAELSAMRSALKVMDGRVRPEPGPDFWRNFDAKLQRQTKESMAPAAAPAAIPFLRRMPQWAWQAAAALVLVGLGIAIGRFYLKEEVPAPVAGNIRTAPQVRTVSTEAETRRFLERSEVLLLGVINADSSNKEAYSADLAQQKKVSSDLIREASLIQGRLTDPKQRRLRELVSDLEVILLQIANLEAQQDQPEVEILKSGVDRKGLLLKINLEQMRLSSPEVAKPKAPGKANSAI